SWVSRTRSSPAAQAKTTGSGDPARPTSWTRTMSSPGRIRRRPRTMSPSKFSSLASFIADQALRSSPGQHDLAQMVPRALKRLDLPPGFLGRLVALLQVILERHRVREIAADYRVHIGQFERVIRLHDGLGGCAGLEGMEHQLQEDPAPAHPEDAGRV